ncbi:YrbL family protein [Ruegeria marisrubri]|nr:YrbL family protein [Ruegeria marisrubri]
MIDLTAARLLRTSRNYRIYDHPTVAGALLKVRSDVPVRRHLVPRYGEWRYGNLRQWNREANEYLAALHRGCPEVERLARFMGYERTNEGPAMVVEKMTDPEGKLAPTVREELEALPKGDPRRRKLLNELMELVDDLERGRIIVGDLSTDNIVRAQERGGRLVVIDGLGERVLLPLTVFSRYAFRKSLERRRAGLAIGFD